MTKRRAAPVDAVLLAGGRGRRAGGPKAFKRIDGELLWRRQARALLEAGARRVAVVLHPDRPEDDRAAPVPTALLLLHSTPEAPMFASLRAGLTALLASPGPLAVGCMVLPVDCPLAGAATTAALLAAARSSSPWSAIHPRHGGRRGHPVVLSAALCSALVAGSPGRRLDLLLRDLPAAERLGIEGGDARVLANHNRNGVSE